MVRRSSGPTWIRMATSTFDVSCLERVYNAPANRGRDTRAMQGLGHRSIQHTVRYTELSPTRFKDFWRE
jgi:hypothetical protein